MSLSQSPVEAGVAVPSVGTPTKGVGLLPWALLPSGLAMSWLIWRARWYWTHNPELQFGWIVLMLCAYVFWEAWDRRPRAQYRWSWANVSMMAGGLLVLFYAQLYQAAFGITTEGMSALGMGAVLFTTGNFSYVFGRPGVRLFFFSFALLFVALPVPETIYYPLVAALKSAVAAANVQLLRLFGIPAIQVGSAIRLPNCLVGIDEACSGIRSLQSAVMATLFIGHLTLRWFPSKTALLVSGMGLAVLGNLGRSLFLSFTANRKGPEALAAVHDTAGWSILLFTAIGVAVLAWLFARFERVVIRSQGRTGSLDR